MKLILERSCCFSGHRKISAGEGFELRGLLSVHIERLLAEGVDTFISGGAMGFDTIAAEELLSLRDGQYPQLRLMLALPFLGQAEGWNSSRASRYERIKDRADEVVYTGDTFGKGVYFVRDRFMVDMAGVCLCYLRDDTVSGGTLYTVNYARKLNRRIINLAGEYEDGMARF